MNATTGAASAQRTSSDSAGLTGVSVCADCAFAQTHFSHEGAVCRHPSHEYSGQVLFEGQPACPAFEGRHGRVLHHLFSSHNV